MTTLLTKSGKGVRLPDPALAYLEEGTALFDDYMDTVHWAQRYAKVNRAIMREDVMAAIQSVLPGAAWSDDEPVVDCHHNSRLCQPKNGNGLRHRAAGHFKFHFT